RHLSQTDYRRRCLFGPPVVALRHCDQDRGSRRALQWTVLRHVCASLLRAATRISHIFHSQEEWRVSLYDVVFPLGEKLTHRLKGVMVGVITNNQDPDGMGRVKVKFPCLSDDEESHWARIAAPMAGKERGIYFLPEVDDEVLVAFEHG